MIWKGCGSMEDGVRKRRDYLARRVVSLVERASISLQLILCCSAGIYGIWFAWRSGPSDLDCFVNSLMGLTVFAAIVAYQVYRLRCALERSQDILYVPPVRE